MHARDLEAGDTGVVWGRSPYNDWLYVKMDKLDVPCWVAFSVVDVTGNPDTVIVQSINLPGPSVLYQPPSNVQAVRNGDQVTVTWNPVWMTTDDDNGYFLDVMVCQNHSLVWTPIGEQALPNYHDTSYTFTDQPGCSQSSGGKIYTVEKHGYTRGVTIPWPPFTSPTRTTGPTNTPVPGATDTPQPTNTPVPPTDTPVPPTASPVPTT
jgi:hypothetical protein